MALVVQVTRVGRYPCPGRALPVSVRRRHGSAPVVQCRRQRADSPADLPQDANLPGSLIQVIKQPGRQQRKQRGSARMHQRAKLAGLEVDITGKVLEPLGGQTSLVLRLPHLGPALPFI